MGDQGTQRQVHLYFDDQHRILTVDGDTSIIKCMKDNLSHLTVRATYTCSISFTQTTPWNPEERGKVTRIIPGFLHPNHDYSPDLDEWIVLKDSLFSESLIRPLAQTKYGYVCTLDELGPGDIVIKCVKDPPKDTTNNEAFGITIQSLNPHPPFSLQVKPSHSIRDVMEMVHDRTGIPPDQQRFMLPPIQLNETDLVGDYLVPGSVVSLLLRLHGGCGPLYSLQRSPHPLSKVGCKGVAVRLILGCSKRGYALSFNRNMSVFQNNGWSYMQPHQFLEHVRVTLSEVEHPSFISYFDCVKKINLIWHLRDILHFLLLQLRLQTSFPALVRAKIMEYMSYSLEEAVELLDESPMQVQPITKMEGMRAIITIKPSESLKPNARYLVRSSTTAVIDGIMEQKSAINQTCVLWTFDTLGSDTLFKEETYGELEDVLDIGGLPVDNSAINCKFSKKLYC